MGLSIWQLKRQLAFLAATAVWAETPGALLLTGGAIISEDLEGNFAPGVFLLDGPVPAVITFARVSAGVWEMDDVQPSRIDKARLTLWLTAGGNWPFLSPPTVDSHGINMENASLRNTTQPQGKSDGRSVDELVTRFIEACTAAENPGLFVDNRHGFQGRLIRGDMLETVNGVTVLKRAAHIEARNATVSNYYHPVRAASALGPTTATVSWTNPPTRFDSFKNEVWRGTNSGDPAPVRGVGTQIILSSNLATSVIDTPGPGRWNYSIFATYTETPAAVTAVVADRASIGVSPPQLTL